MGCDTPDICGPVSCSGVLITACCSCVDFPDCEIDDDDNGGDPFCPAECLAGYVDDGGGDDDGFDPGGGGHPDGFGGDCDDPPKPPPGPPIPPRPDPGPIDPGGPITYWVCTQNNQCIPITQARDLPPPPGSWRTEAECLANCGGRDDPDDPGERGDITYWVCVQVNPWSKKCKSVTQARDLPPPPGSWRTLAACKDNCDSGGGGGHGGGGGDPISGGGIPPGGGPGVYRKCACVMEETPTIQGTAFDCPQCPPGARIMTATWNQKCERVPLTGPNLPPFSYTKLRNQYSSQGPLCFNVNSADIQNDCKDKTITSNKNPCTDPNKKCVPIKLTWCEWRTEPGDPTGGGGGGSANVCECKIVGKPTRTYVQTETTKGITLTWKQKCSPGQESGDQATIDKVVEEELKHMSSSWVWNCGKMYQTGSTGANCIVPGVPPAPPTCTGPCGKITVYLECTKDTTGEGDSDSIGGGMLDGGGGGGDITRSDITDSIGGNLFDDEGNPIFGGSEGLTANNLKQTDPSLDPYDDEYNIRISNDSFRAKLATRMIQKSILDNNNLFKDIINQSLNTFLISNPNSSFVPYNGTTLSTFIYQEGIIQDSLSPYTKQLINGLNTFNMAALDLTQMMYRAIKRAAYTDTYEAYNSSLLIELLDSSNQLAEPIPILHNQNVPSSNRAVGLDRIRKSRYSMYAKNTTNGDMQRRVQAYHMLPTDYNLKVPVYTRSGVTGVRVANDDTIDVVAWSGVHVKIGEKNDYLAIKHRSGNDIGVALKSKRSQAQAFNLPDLSIIHGYLKRANKGSESSDPKYSFNLSVSTSYDDNVELSSGTALKAGYLVKLTPSSIGSIEEDIVNFRQTSAVYVSAWEEGDDDALFNATVSSYSGPRNMVYIESGDPWWNHFLKTRTLTATYTDLDIDGFDNYIYPRRVNVDMLLVPVEKIDYNLLQGESELTQYTSEGVVRDVRIMISPLSRVFNTGYISPAKKPDEQGWNNKGDTWATMYSKNFNEVAVKRDVLTSEDPSTDQSILGRFLSKIDEIKAAYNIESSPGIEGIPQSDLLSFFTVDEVVQYLFSVPPQIRNKLFAGAYNNIKIINILDVDVEKTYISSDRLVSGQTSLESSRYYTKVPNLDSHYFEDRYEGILFTYAPRT